MEVAGEDDYHGYQENKKRFQNQLTEESRFVPVNSRENRTVLTDDMFKVLCHGKFQTFWKGIENLKGCIELIIFQDLFWEVKPKTIIEIGAYMGGSALWMRDTVKAQGLDPHIYSLDIDLNLLHPSVKDASGITFIEGDSYKIEEAFPPEMMKALPHPIVITEDAHMNLKGVMEYFHQFLQKGDYIIVEDTNPYSPKYTGMGLFGDYVRLGSSKLNEMKDWLGTHPGEYAVDTKYADMFGHNGCWNMDGYLCRL